MPRSDLRFRFASTLFLISAFAVTPARAQGLVPFNGDQVARGQVIYSETCQICHGNRLSNGQFGTPLRGSFFRNNWRGKSLGDLAQHTWEKMPPDNVQSLSWEQVTDVLAFILSRNDIEPGETAMTTDMDNLRGIPLPWE